MARRANSNVNVVQLLIAICLVILVGIVGYKSLIPNNGKNEASSKGSGNLDVENYLENSNALSSNSYEIEGIIDERLDNWPSEKGRLFSIIIEDKFKLYPVPVLIPHQFNATNIQRGQRFRIKVTVQSSTGILEATHLSKS